MPMDYSKGLSTKEYELIQDIKKGSKIALRVAVTGLIMATAGLIVAIVAIIVAILC